jgi:acyl carrier protein
MSSEETSATILGFIRERLLDGDPASELEETTPLLEWGVLTSMNTAHLLAFLRDEFGVMVPAVRVNGETFRNVRSITAMVTELENGAIPR